MGGITTGTAIAQYVNKHMSTTDVYTDDMYLKEAYDTLCTMKNVNAKKQTFELFKKYIGCILLIEGPDKLYDPHNEVL